MPGRETGQSDECVEAQGRGGKKATGMDAFWIDVTDDR